MIVLRAMVIFLSMLAAVLTGSATAAHETTRSYLTLERDGARVDAQLRVAFRDIEVVTWMDEDLDGRITWGEARRRLDAVEAYVRSGLSFEAGGACDLARNGADASSSGGIDYLDLGFDVRCPSSTAPLILRTRLFSETDPDHRMFLQASVGGATTSALLSAAEPSIEMTGESGGATEAFLSYFRSGIEHLLGGADHLVFLLILMLPAVCSSNGARQAALGVLAAVTGFTLAHALTLSAAATEILRPPTMLIEALIALSIVITAVDNVRPFIPAPRAGVAAFFGIIHGFGFASALGVLALTGRELAVALVGFNLGIEVAQVGVVLVTMPVLFLLGHGRLVLLLGSSAAGLVGLWWLWVRLSPMLLGG